MEKDFFGGGEDSGKGKGGEYLANENFVKEKKNGEGKGRNVWRRKTC